MSKRSTMLLGMLGLCLLPFLPISLEGQADAFETPAIQAFLGRAGDGFGARHGKAPPETDQFGRLVGLWETEQEIRRQDGSWVKGTAGLWAWKYAIDGFAVQDLWYQSADNLPPYMASLGRTYQLTSMRIFEVASKKWKVAWMANGGGATPGADFGVFEATGDGDRVIMTSPPGPGAFGYQRVVFSDVTPQSFNWTSEYSQDNGATWNAAMRVKARRIVPQSQ